MKKIFSTLLIFVVSMSMNAQVMKLMKGNNVVASYTAEEVDNVVFEELPTTGTAKRTGDIDVKWVQLWANGPKFAEYSVGAEDETKAGTRISFAEAIATGDDYVWGANWCTPSKEDLEELLKAATNEGSTKVKCELYYEFKNPGDPRPAFSGLKFTGLEEGYTENSVFFPSDLGPDTYSAGINLWTSSASGDNAWRLQLSYSHPNFRSFMDEITKEYTYRVRPVLKNN